MKLPPIKLDHLKALTDNAGILQHAKYSIPNRSEGYTTDDNARALIACIKHNHRYDDAEMENLETIYLGFLVHMQRSNGQFRNLLSYERHFLDDVGSEDCMGRALWACGYAIDSSLSEGKKMVAKEIFDKGFPWTNDFKSLRAKALAILGLHHYQHAFPNDQNLSLNIRLLADQLCESYYQNSSPSWRWFEPYLTYSNARLPQALIEAYTSTGSDSYLKISQESLTFLIEQQILENIFVPFGNQNWYLKNEKRTRYDQQPLEASCMVETATRAFRILGDDTYLRIANAVFSWFLGNNSQNVRVYNSQTGGCHDGITPQGVNLNQGAESTISYLLARLALETIY
jgi:hypothetical protein